MPSLLRTLAIAAGMGVVALGASQAAEPTAPQPARETVDQRIASLHDALAITPHEEAKWHGVSTVMQANAAAIQKLMARKSAEDPAKETAVSDLMDYQAFAHAHATGSTKLTRAFAILYQAMPDAQKKTADQVFQNFGHGKSEAPG